VFRAWRRGVGTPGVEVIGGQEWRVPSSPTDRPAAEVREFEVVQSGFWLPVAFVAVMDNGAGNAILHQDWGSMVLRILQRLSGLWPAEI
jgi:hypothetical protein